MARAGHERHPACPAESRAHRHGGCVCGPGQRHLHGLVHQADQPGRRGALLRQLGRASLCSPRPRPVLAASFILRLRALRSSTFCVAVPSQPLLSLPEKRLPPDVSPSPKSPPPAVALLTRVGCLALRSLVSASFRWCSPHLGSSSCLARSCQLACQPSWTTACENPRQSGLPDRIHMPWVCARSRGSPFAAASLQNSS